MSTPTLPRSPGQSAYLTMPLIIDSAFEAHPFTLQVLIVACSQPRHLVSNPKAMLNKEIQIFASSAPLWKELVFVVLIQCARGLHEETPDGGCQEWTKSMIFLMVRMAHLSTSNSCDNVRISGSEPLLVSLTYKLYQSRARSSHLSRFFLHVVVSQNHMFRLLFLEA